MGGKHVDAASGAHRHAQAGDESVTAPLSVTNNAPTDDDAPHEQMEQKKYTKLLRPVGERSQEVCP